MEKFNRSKEKSYFLDQLREEYWATLGAMLNEWCKDQKIFENSWDKWDYFYSPVNNRFFRERDIALSYLKTLDEKSVIWLFYDYIDGIKKYYGNDMIKIDFWIQQSPYLMMKNNLDILLLWKICANYVAYFIWKVYPHNLLDEEFLLSIAPYYMRLFLQYIQGYEVLGEVFNDGYLLEERFLRLRGASFHFLQDNKLLLQTSSKRWMVPQTEKKWIYSTFIFPSFEERTFPYILKDFIFKCQDKILISHLRHNKTDYDTKDFDDEGVMGYRLSWRNTYNVYCRAKYLEWTSKMWVDVQWNEVEYVEIKDVKTNSIVYFGSDKNGNFSSFQIKN